MQFQRKKLSLLCSFEIMVPRFQILTQLETSLYLFPEYLYRLQIAEGRQKFCLRWFWELEFLGMISVEFVEYFLCFLMMYNNIVFSYLCRFLKTTELPSASRNPLFPPWENLHEWKTPFFILMAEYPVGEERLNGHLNRAPSTDRQSHINRLVIGKISIELE